MNKYIKKVLLHSFIIFISVFIIALINGVFLIIPFFISLVSGGLYFSFNNKKVNVEDSACDEESHYVKEVFLVRNKNLSKVKKRVLRR